MPTLAVGTKLNLIITAGSYQRSYVVSCFYARYSDCGKGPKTAKKRVQSDDSLVLSLIKCSEIRILCTLTRNVQTFQVEGLGTW